MMMGMARDWPISVSVPQVSILSLEYDQVFDSMRIEGGQNVLMIFEHRPSNL